MTPCAVRRRWDGSVWTPAYLAVARRLIYALLGAISALVWSSPVCASGDPGAGVVSSSSHPASAFLNTAPPEAQHVAPVLLGTVNTFAAAAEARKAVKHLRAEQDSVKTKLTAVASELTVLAQERQRLEQQLEALERDRQQRLDSLRRELEAKLTAELSTARQETAQELERELTQRVQAFEARQRSVIEHGLDQDLSLKERELVQLRQEIEVQTQELVDRLGRLEVGTELAKSLDRSMSDAVARRRAELDARRKQLTAERDALLAKQRAELVEQIKQQQRTEQERRLTLKEASLRSSMASLLAQTAQETAKRMAPLERSIADLTQRADGLAQQQASLNAQMAELERAIGTKGREMEGLESQHQAALTQLEEAFQKPNTGLKAEALSWLAQTGQQAPPELSVELGLLQQRLLARAQQEEELRKRNRLLRERQLALQLSREMASQYQELQARKHREQETASRKTEELLGRIGQLVKRGRFDDALQLVAEAQALNPPQRSELVSLQERLMAERDRAARQTQTAQIERAFTRAMQVFNAGRYEEAIPLFEQVIAQEGTLEGTQAVQGAAVGGRAP